MDGTHHLETGYTPSWSLLAFGLLGSEGWSVGLGTVMVGDSHLFEFPLDGAADVESLAALQVWLVL